MLGEVFACYHAEAHGKSIALPPVRPYRDYIAWLEKQDVDAAEVFWRRMLRGFRTATPLGVDRPPRQTREASDSSIVLKSTAGSD